ncbi:MAG: ssDNA-binding protein [Geminicoccales bacterium]
MSTQENPGRVISPEARIVQRPHLFEPRTEMNGKPQTPKFELTMAFEPDDIGAMKAAAVAVAKAKWPGRDLKGMKFPFKRGDVVNQKREEKGKKPYPAYAGKIILAAKSGEDRPPEVIGPDGKEMPRVRAKDIYSGCYGFAVLNFSAYEGSEEDGVTTYLNGFGKSRDGDRIGGGDARTLLAGVLGKNSNEDPTEGLDDEIPL